jgi:hypothetical protein
MNDLSTMHIPHNNSRVERAGHNAIALEQQRVDAIGVALEHMQAPILERTPHTYREVIRPTHHIPVFV